MKRRSFLAGAGVVAATAATLPKPAIASGVKRLKMVTTWPKNFPGMGVSAERLATRIKTMTEGQVEIRVYAADELVPALQAFDTVSSGAAEVYHGAEYYWQGKSPAFNFFTTVPNGMIATELNAWMYHGGGQQLWDELSAQFNIKPFMASNTGVQMGGWFRKEINTLEDFKGLRIRMPGLGGEVMRKLDAAAVTLAGNQIYQALQNGTIDATEWVGPWNDMTFGFHQVADYYYWPGFHEPGPALAVGFNKTVWDGFTPSQQAAVEAACAAENDYTLAEFNYQNAKSLQTLIKDHNVKLRRFSPEIRARLTALSDEVVEEAGNSDAFTKRVYESYKASLALSREWTRIADQAFVEARQGIALD
ncbi:TRAP transporter substrate-binding protein [Tepidicaulis sp. LMO-SS28]|uniref:TRAP transporter substrate-binding protein n=1 Tax=Tepidicaulis sp. LMO-SS28 TaxID=3447455 RepID=UPI003EE19295